MEQNQIKSIALHCLENSLDFETDLYKPFMELHPDTSDLTEEKENELLIPFLESQGVDIDGYDEYNSKYLILTEDEAETEWDRQLDSYLDECVLPDLPENVRRYFDSEKWKDDARHDGRGHAIASYDGNEDEITLLDETFCVFRIN